MTEIQLLALMAATIYAGAINDPGFTYADAVEDATQLLICVEAKVAPPTEDPS